jgi:coenzyme F420-reducing hydrogenase alpha subunit
MGIEGSIRIELDWDGRAIRCAQVRSSRPVTASRLLEGKDWRDAEAMVPMLFGICGRAQTVCAAAALEAARGVEPDHAVALQRELLIAAECIHEYAWRILLDLPKLLGSEADAGRFIALRQALRPVLDQAAADSRWWHAPASGAALDRWCSASASVSQHLADNVFGMPAAGWLALDYDEPLNDWIVAESTPTAALLGRLFSFRLGTSAVPLLPALSVPEMAAELAPMIAGNAEFAAAPTWRGAPAETGALARTADHPLIAGALRHAGNTVAARFLARLVELAKLERRLASLSRGRIQGTWSASCGVAPGAGLCATETARGTLFHLVRMEADRVASYRIVAPTEWNFHPQGALVHGLAGVAAETTDAAEQAARLLTHALDPCVSFKVAVIAV